MDQQNVQFNSEQEAELQKWAAIGRAAAVAAHKINNHLTTILTFSHLMRDKANMDAQDREDLSLIIHETTQAAAVAKTLLDSSRDARQV